ncbi:hypothetical protein [Sulfobacillus harzensis]|uniref:Uncharacterized protein n=1 Tax=Sulfobacillus harzensis TaxID=2729629 RepID=A0A7Y0L7I9_9FIRM|nr:hypothetical protein [Sulfobacillus harzensis]NMP24747.1 hypothetical protein [Sulfobacillus harzensis]
MSIDEQFVMVDGSPALRKLARETGYRYALCPRIHVLTIPDRYPDLSFLEQSYDDVTIDDRQRYQAEDRARRESFGTSWTMMGIRAVATVYVPLGPGAFQRLVIPSMGCFGVESDSGPAYLRQVGEEELANLRDVLAMLRVHEPVDQVVEWDVIFQQAV